MQSRCLCGILPSEVAKGGGFLQPICYIVGAMEPGEIVISPRSEALVIAADGGLAHLEKRGIAPDWIVGDFDSLDTAPQGENVIRHPVEKDDTDTMLAVKTGLARGCRDFVIYGGVGGRTDHTYANFQTLSYIAAHGGRGWLVAGGMVATVIEGAELSFPSGMEGTISVFCPGGEAKGVTLKGLYYSLDAARLTDDFPLGVSNRFTGAEASVSVAEGRLLVMWEESAAVLVFRLEEEARHDL